MSKPEQVELPPEQKSADTATASDAAADKLRDESYKLLSYCDRVGKDNGTGICTTPDGDLVIEIPALGRLVVKPDKSVVHMPATGGYLLKDKDNHVTYAQYPDGKVRTFQYDNSGDLNGWTTPDGTKTFRVFDYMGQQVWMMEKDGRLQTTSMTHATVTDDGDLVTTLPSGTYTYRPDGHIIGSNGQESKEVDSQGRLVKEVFAHATREVRYGAEGCIDELTMSRQFLAVKTPEGWANMSLAGKKHGDTMDYSQNYVKYSSLQESCRVDEQGNYIEVSRTETGKEVKIEAKSGETTTLNYDKSGELVSVLTATTTKYTREGLVWKSNGPGARGPEQTFSYRDMAFNGLDDRYKQLDCLSDAAMRGQ